MLKGYANDLTDEAVREHTLKLWRQVKREFVEDLVCWLTDESDYFTAPCSTKFHLAVPGGLARHSLNVLGLLTMKAADLQLDEKYRESIIVCALGHDLCKTGFYKRVTRREVAPFNPKDQCDLPIRVTEAWEVDDQLPLGHGEKSLFLLQQFIPVTDEEALAIRWHMTAFDASVHFPYPNGHAYNAAVKKTPLVTLLFTADFEASQIIEAEEEDRP